MKDFILENFETIASVLVSVILALSSMLGVNTIRINRLSKRVKEAKSNGYRIRCPKCKKESPLSEVSFLMPDGSLDNDLDGKAD